MMSSSHAYVVGSMLRPDYLREARLDEETDTDDLARLENQSILDCVSVQEKYIDIVTDGEQRRNLFQDSLGTIVDGIRPVPGGEGGIVVEAAMGSQTYANEDDVETNTQERGYTSQALVEPLQKDSSTSLALNEYRFAQSITDRSIKITFPSPSVVTLTYWSPKRSFEAYSNVSEALMGWAEILKDEVRALVSEGCQYIQFDAPDLTFPVGDWAWAYEKAGFDRQSFLRESVEAINDVASVPGAEYSLHICRGNDQGRFHTSGGYESISKEIFPRIDNVNYLFLEYDSERAGDFQPLADVPNHKMVILGLISTKHSQMERIEDLQAEIEKASQFHPIEKLGISPQCGFASVVSGNPVSYEDQESKLRLVQEVAEKTWGSNT